MYYILFNVNINYQFYKYYALLNHISYVYFHSYFCNRLERRKIIALTTRFIENFELSTVDYKLDLIILST